MVAGQALMAGDPGAVENSKREARESAHVNLVEGQNSGGADRIAVGEFHGEVVAHPSRLGARRRP